MITSDKAAFIEAMDVSRETLERLDVFEALLRKWTPAINLVSSATLSEVWTRHFLDSAQLWPHRGSAPRLWADLGSGAGFPGLVAAILAAEKQPDLRTVLVESDQRKAAFLAVVIREAGLNAQVVAERIEAAKPLQADVVSARAVAPLSKLFDWGSRHMAPGGRALFLKGASHGAELEAARVNWRFSVEETPSLTDPNAVVLNIGELSHV